MREMVAGLAWRSPRAYLRPMATQSLGPLWNYLTRFNPFRALRDLRRFLYTRQTHEIWFMFASAAMCILIVSAFVADSSFEKPYVPPEIIYVKSWRADRTDAEIIAQQKIDQAIKERDDAKRKKLEDANKAAFKRLNDKLSPWL